MKNKVIIVVVVSLVYMFFSRETVVDKLLKVDLPITISHRSGIQFYDPEIDSTVDMADQLENNLITVVYLYKSTCKSCQIFDKHLKKLVTFRPDVAVTKIPSPSVAGYNAQYKGEKLNIWNLPFIMIFDRAGNLLASDKGKEYEGYDLFYEWLNEEIDRKNAQLKEEWIRKRTSQNN